MCLKEYTLNLEVKEMRLIKAIDKIVNRFFKMKK